MPTLCPSCGTKNIEGVDECAACGADLRTVDLPQPVSEIEQSLMHLPLTALQVHPPSVIEPGETLQAAIDALVAAQTDMLEVVEGGRLVGVLSVRDILTRVGADYREKLSRPVREFMTSNPDSLPPDAPITFALNKMDIGGYRHVPVVQDERLVGMISIMDAIRHIVKHRREKVVTAGRTTSHGSEGKSGS